MFQLFSCKVLICITQLQPNMSCLVPLSSVFFFSNLEWGFPLKELVILNVWFLFTFLTSHCDSCERKCGNGSGHFLCPHTFLDQILCCFYRTRSQRPQCDQRSPVCLYSCPLMCVLFWENTETFVTRPKDILSPLSTGTNQVWRQIEKKDSKHFWYLLEFFLAL